jgi:hypothetical protein
LSDFKWEYFRPFVEWYQKQRQRADGRGGRWNQLTRRRIKRYTGGYMKPLPAPSVPGNTEAERFDNAVRKTFTVSKEEMQRRDADWQKTNGEEGTTEEGLRYGMGLCC